MQLSFISSLEYTNILVNSILYFFCWQKISITLFFIFNLNFWKKKKTSRKIYDAWSTSIIHKLLTIEPTTLPPSKILTALQLRFSPCCKQNSTAAATSTHRNKTSIKFLSALRLQSIMSSSYNLTTEPLIPQSSTSIPAVFSISSFSILSVHFHIYKSTLNKK